MKTKTVYEVFATVRNYNVVMMKQTPFFNDAIEALKEARKLESVVFARLQKTTYYTEA